MKRVGILGGTFNPIHIGHLAIAQTVYDRLKLDTVIFIPSHYPPHKTRRGVVSGKHRFNMIHLAIKDQPHFLLDDFELNRLGKSFSIYTLEYLNQKYPSGTKFFFIIGSDMLTGLKKWRRINDLLKLTQFVAVGRKGYEKHRGEYKVRMISGLDLDLSSSLLRRNLKEGKSVKYLLPGPVLAYIKRHKLYTS